MRRKLVAALLLAIILILAGLRIASPPDDARGRASPPVVEAPPAPAQPAAAVASAEPAPEAAAESPPEVPAPSPRAVPTPPPAPPLPPAALDPLPVIEPFPGLRFEASFADWLPPRIHGVAEWRIIGYRESLTGCRRVDPIPLGRAVGPMAFRIHRVSPVDRPEVVDDGVSLAVFLLAVPFDAQGAPLGEHLVAHSAEAHSRVRDLEADPSALLHELAATVDFSVHFEDVPPDWTARGWFEHAAVAARWPAAELSSRLPLAFPASPEEFANALGRLRFAGARFDAPIGPMTRLEVSGWPRGMLWPDSIELRTDRASMGLWALAEPESLRISGAPRRSGFEPLLATTLVYRRGPDVPMPPIEIIGAPLSEEILADAVVVAEGDGFAAEARFDPETGSWVWSVSRANTETKQNFRAILFVPGATPTDAPGRTHSEKPVLFVLGRAKSGAVLGQELLVAPGLRLDIPITYELDLRHGTTPWKWSGRGLARGGIFTLGGLSNHGEGQLALEVDAIEWALRLEADHQRRWGRDLRPLEVYAEAIGTTSSGATVLEVTVEHNGEEWTLAEFLEEFDLAP